MLTFSFQFAGYVKHMHKSNNVLRLIHCQDPSKKGEYCSVPSPLVLSGSLQQEATLKREIEDGSLLSWKSTGQVQFQRRAIWTRVFNPPETQKGDTFRPLCASLGE